MTELAQDIDTRSVEGDPEMKPPRINANRIKINVHVSGLRRLRFRFWLLGWWCVVARLIGARVEVMQCVDIVPKTKGAAEGWKPHPADWKPHPADCFCIDCLPGVDEPEADAASRTLEKYAR